MSLRLGTDLKGDTGSGGLGVVDGLSTGLNVSADTVVVAGREEVHVVETVDGDGVVRGTVANGRRVPGDLALGDVVGCLSTDEETVTTEHGVSGESGALEDVRNCSPLAAWVMRTLNTSRTARVWNPDCL